MILTYVIIDGDDVDSVTGWGGETIIETSAETLHWNVAKNKTFVKFVASDPTPSFLEGKTQYTNVELLAILTTSEWSPSSFPPIG